MTLFRVRQKTLIFIFEKLCVVRTLLYHRIPVQIRLKIQYEVAENKLLVAVCSKQK